MAKTLQAELVLDAQALTGEGPFWSVAEKALYWVDIPAGLVHRYDPRTQADEVLELGQPVGVVVPRAKGGLIAALKQGIASLDATGRLSMLVDVESDNDRTRANDGKCDVAGRFWVGTMAEDPLADRGAGALYRLDPDLKVTKVLKDVGLANGLGWSPDSSRMYFIDSLGFSVDSFDFDPTAGQLANRHRLVEVPADSNALVVPDGMTVDAEGCLWIAFWNGSCVRRYAPDATLLQTIDLPVAQVTSCAFGGEDLGDLYITTGRNGLSQEALSQQPLAGGLFRCRPGVQGLAAREFAG